MRRILINNARHQVRLYVEPDQIKLAKEEFFPRPGTTMRCWYPLAIQWKPRKENSLLSGGMGRPVKVAYNTHTNWRCIGITINRTHESKAKWKKGLLKIG